MYIPKVWLTIVTELTFRDVGIATAAGRAGFSRNGEKIHVITGILLFSIGWKDNRLCPRIRQLELRICGCKAPPALAECPTPLTLLILGTWILVTNGLHKFMSRSSSY